MRSSRLSDGTRRQPANVKLQTRSNPPWKHSDVRLRRARSRDSVQPAPVSSSVVLSLGHAMGSTVRQAVAGGDMLDRLGLLSSPSASVTRREATIRNTLFGMFFETVDADAALSPVDGALYTYSDLVAFIQCVIYLRGKAISD